MAMLVCASTVTAEIGQWDFNSGNFAPTTGASLGALEYFDGIGGATELATVFNTTTALGIPNINGTPAAVMAFPACTSAMGYNMPTPTVPNGTNDTPQFVNSWSLIMDLLYTGDSANVWRSLIQIDGAGDGDLFINASGGIGISSLYSGQILSNTWQRVGFVFDLTNGVLRKYINGTLVGSQAYTTQDSRWALTPSAWAVLFTDNDGETASGYVNSIQLRDTPLTSSQMFALGGPSAAGIPISIPVFTNLNVTVTPTNQSDVVGMSATYFSAFAVGSGTYTYQWYRNGSPVSGQTNANLRILNVQASNAGNYTIVVNNGIQSATSAPPCVLTISPTPAAFVTGQWDFNQGDLSATFGQPLQYFDATVQADTLFGTTTSFGIVDIAGQPANVMYYAPSLSSWGGYVMTHDIGGNGGGTNANQYTLIFDLLCPSSSMNAWRSLFQTDPSNTTDGEAFFNPGNGVGISSTYQGTLTGDEWHRVTLAFDLTKREFGKYIDGTNVLTGPIGASPLGVHDAQYLSNSTDPLAGGGVDLRWSLQSTALLLGDNDGDLQPMYISSMQVRNGRMTDASIAAMGTPTANKIPGSIKAAKSGNTIVISWTGNVLESASNPVGPWSQVIGAAHPHVLATPTGNQFFRVRQ